MAEFEDSMPYFGISSMEFSPNGNHLALYTSMNALTILDSYKLMEIKKIKNFT